MFWTDWSSTKPCIKRATLDGKSITDIVTGRGNIYWPNGIAIDEQHEKIYWTDAHLDHIAMADLDGHGIMVVVRSTPHPYAIAIFKVSGQLRPLLTSLVWSCDTREHNLEMNH